MRLTGRIRRNHTPPVTDIYTPVVSNWQRGERGVNDRDERSHSGVLKCPLEAASEEGGATIVDGGPDSEGREQMSLVRACLVAMRIGHTSHLKA